MLFKCILKIFLRVDLIAHLVLQLESEVSHDPEERGEIASYLLVVFDLNLIGQVDNERQVLYCVLVYCAHRVVDEVGAQ